MAETATADPVRDDRGSDRRDPPRADGGRLRRRDPRERGRPDDGGPVRDPGGDQLHGQGGARADLPDADRRALRRARAQPDGGQERGAAADRVHGLGRGARGRHHRDLGRRPRAHDPGRDRRPLDARSRWCSPATCSRCGPRTAGVLERAGQTEAAVDLARLAGLNPAGRDLRDHERRRDDGPGARPGPVLRAPRAEDDHGRRPDRLPAAHRAAGRAGRRDQAADRLRRVHRGRLPLAARRQAPRRDGQGQRRRGRGRARPGPLRVPDRRRLPLAALRLRRAARGGDGDDRAARARASCSTSPRRGAGSAC